MPVGRRGLDDFDPNKSDPEDEDYDVKTPRSKSSRPTKIHRKKPTRKRKRNPELGSASEDLSESEVPSDESFEDEVQEQPELDPRTGRPLRKTTKRRPQYLESDGDSIDFMNELNSSGAEEQPVRKKLKKASKQSLIVKLKTTASSEPVPRRPNRKTSGSVASRRVAAPDPSGITRRSSRIAHDDTEGLYALTNSGNHIEFARPPTKSPDVFPQRPTRASKGIKKPPSAIAERSEEDLPETKEEFEADEPPYEPETEVAASGEEPGEAEDNATGTKVVDAVQHDSVEGVDEDNHSSNQSAIVPESNDEDDEDIAMKPRRNTRTRATVEESDKLVNEASEIPEPPNEKLSRRSLRSIAQTRAEKKIRKRKRGIDDTSDFEPGADEAGEDDLSSSSRSASSSNKGSQEPDDSSTNARRSKRVKTTTRFDVSADHDEELLEELEELKPSRSRRAAQAVSQGDDRPQTRKRKPVDYRIMRPDLAINLEDDGPPPAITPSRKGRGGGGGAWQRSLFSIEGPFGGAGGPPPVLGGPGGIGATGGVDSDSSDDESAIHPRPSGLGGAVGMTPTTAAPPGFGAFGAAQTHGADLLQANLGKIKDKQALADADPLGVDPNVTFAGVGGLDGHIDQLKEMVALPLLYPEVFQRFRITPPRGVLFHGPPGTGKTLLARALASSVSSAGKKVTFYMRKGADALSKWVGEAERQLRLLFEEARKNQPSIIFFDEIDGLAPVRSSKQEQIHASIVSTLLALMDGMDGRGQVVVIGATNRPDSVDPALRRPGRFDREFYFPLPNKDARRKILDIHTADWEPPLQEALKDDLAEITKGYGGADLRALCTEAALNAVQRRYPQIYTSNAKLLIKPETIKIAAKDFMISIKRIVPSSERSASSGAAPLPSSVEPLLKHQLLEVEELLKDILPQKKPVTALEEAKFEDAIRDEGMKTEKMLQEFERSQVFRPRLLLRGPPGMGQQYLVNALIHHFDGLHVQSFDLSTLLGDPTRSAESAIVQLFSEVKRHKPSVIYVPNVDAWYHTVGHAVISTFLGLLRSLSPSDPVLLLGVLESDNKFVDPQMLKDLFGFSTRNHFHLQKPSRDHRQSFFQPLEEYLRTSPANFPNPANRKLRVLEPLEPAPAESQKASQTPTKEQLKAQKKKDRHTLNVLKVRIQPIMEQIKLKYKKFRTGVVDDNAIKYLFEEEDPSIVTSDLPHDIRQQAMFRPYEKSVDEHGEPGLLESASGKFYYNLEIVTIEKRLANGYYQRPKDFLADIKKLTKDAKTLGDPERMLKSQELQTNVEVDMMTIEHDTPAFAAECEALYQRELQRHKARTQDGNVRQGDTNATAAATANHQAPTAGSSAEKAHSNGASSGHSNNRQSRHSSLTNGISDLSDLQGHQNSNGNSDPSRNEDAPMTNSDDISTPPATESSFGPSAQARPVYIRTGGPANLEQRASFAGSLSQRGLITPMAEGSTPQMYENSASTTSSDKRMTGSSGAFATPSNREKPGSSRGREDQDISMVLEDTQSHLPDTQEPPLSQSQHSVPNSSQSLPPSQPPVPQFPRKNAINSLLNEEPSIPKLTIDATGIQRFLERLVNETSPCSVEQLEQIFSALMAEIWRTRGNWNRNSVVERLQTLSKELLNDMKSCQDFGPSSQDVSQSDPSARNT